MLKTTSSKNGKALMVVRQLSIALSRSERNNMLKLGEFTLKVQCMIIKNEPTLPYVYSMILLL